jgi:murein DD-endopeptidase MepM/ murein hydrolase activator NlpD
MPYHVQLFASLSKMKLFCNLIYILHKRIPAVSVILFILPASFCTAQVFPQNYFMAPMDTPLYLSAPFGSLRENHFHSGMDIRTNEKEGLPVYAVADGYVSRIKVSSGGYGKAVYIDHPNGYTSVYAHLQKYEGELAAYIKKYQYEKESFEFDHFPGRDRIRVNKGQIIGWSGNSGTSTGPHLHFEIRGTKSEEPLNPQLFNIPAADFYPPVLKRFAVFDLNTINSHLVYNESVHKRNTILTDSGVVYKDTIMIPGGTIGFGIDAVDYLVNETKEYSIYCSDLSYDGRKLFSFRLDRINFDDTKCINAHIDYELYKKEGYRIQKCFLDDGNRISLYPYMRNKGKITVNDTLPHTIKLCIGDFSGKSYNFYAVVKSSGLTSKFESICTNNTFYPLKDNTLKEPGLLINVPARVLYDTVNICTARFSNKNKALLSDVFQVHNPYTPLHRNMSVSIKTDTFINKNQLLLAYINKDGSFRSAGGEYANGWVTGRVSQFGNYAIAADSVPPEIRLLNADKNGICKDTSRLTIRITDNLSGIASYKVMLDGKWVLAEFDAKNDMLIYEFDENTRFNIKQQLIVIISDPKKNTTTLQKEIIFAR